MATKVSLSGLGRGSSVGHPLHPPVLHEFGPPTLPKRSTAIAGVFLRGFFSPAAQLASFMLTRNQLSERVRE